MGAAYPVMRPDTLRMFVSFCVSGCVHGGTIVLDLSVRGRGNGCMVYLSVAQGTRLLVYTLAQCANYFELATIIDNGNLRFHRHDSAIAVGVCCTP